MFKKISKLAPNPNETIPTYNNQRLQSRWSGNHIFYKLNPNRVMDLIFIHNYNFLKLKKWFLLILCLDLNHKRGTFSIKSQIWALSGTNCLILFGRIQKILKELNLLAISVKGLFSSTFGSTLIKFIMH